MSKSTKILLGIICLFIVAFIVYITIIIKQPNQISEKITPIKIGSFSKAIDYAPYLVAKNKGWFEELAKKYNTTVEYTEFQSLPPINEALATDNIDIIFEAEPPAIVGRSAGIGVKIISAGVDLTQEIIVNSESNINTVSDLKGKKIAVLAGTGSHYGIGKVLTEKGLSLSDVEIIDMIPPDAKAAFESRQVDAWAVWPPFPQQEELAGKGRGLNGSEIFIQSIVAAREKFIKENPKLTQDLLIVINRSQEWIVNNEENSKQIVAAELDLPIEVVELAWSKHNFQPKFNENAITDIQAKADFMYDLKFIKNKVEVDSDLICNLF